jgi:ubiquinone/menaquinone biosynthesis C-methylase UbiE
MNVEIERFDPSSATPPWVRHEHLARFRFGAGFVKDRMVVDCACGTGEGTRMFAEMGASHVHAFDVSPDAVTATEMRCQALNVTVSVADAQALPLPDASADVFISLETFEHLIDPESLLSEACRILKCGGTFICSSPNRDVSSPGNSLQSKPWNRFHTREYSQAEFLGAVESRFSSCKMLGQNPVSVRRAKLMRRLGRLFSVICPVRLNQVLKLPRFVYGNPGRHIVQAWKPGFEYEYCMVVCTKA